MPEPQSDARGSSSASFLSKLRAPIALLSSAFHTRLELFVAEAEEERERLKQTFVLLLLVYFGLSFGLILLTIFAVALFWQNGWIMAIGGLAALYLGIGVVSGLMLRRKFLTRPGLFSATLSELNKDLDQLKSASHD